MNLVERKEHFSKRLHQIDIENMRRCYMNVNGNFKKLGKKVLRMGEKLRNVKNHVKRFEKVYRNLGKVKANLMKI